MTPKYIGSILGAHTKPEQNQFKFQFTFSVFFSPFFDPPKRWSFFEEIRSLRFRWPSGSSTISVFNLILRPIFSLFFSMLVVCLIAFWAADWRQSIIFVIIVWANIISFVMWFMVQFIIRSHLFRLDSECIWKCHPPTQNSLAVNSNWMLPFREECVTDTRVSNISNVSRSLSARAKMLSRARDVCKIRSFFCSSFNWNRFCCWDVVYLISHCGFVVGRCSYADPYSMFHPRCTWWLATSARRPKNTMKIYMKNIFSTANIWVRMCARPLRTDTGSNEEGAL